MATARKRGDDGSLEALSEKLGSSPNTLRKLMEGRHRKQSSFEETKAVVLSALGFTVTDDFRRMIKFKRFRGYEAGSECLGFGGNQTLFYAAAVPATDKRVIPMENVTVTFRPEEQVRTDRAISDLIKHTEATWRAGMSGRRPAFNDQMLTLLSGDIPDTKPGADGSEESCLSIEVGLSDYEMFYALRSTEPGLRLVAERMRAWTPDTLIVPEMSSGLGVSIAVFTEDDSLVIGRRKRDRPGPRSGELEIGVCEGLRVNDIQVSNIHPNQTGSFDVRLAFLRALNEELGLQPEDLMDLQLLCMGFDLEYAQWNLIGVARTKLTLEKLKSERHGNRAKDRYELRIFDTPSGLENIVQWVGHRSERLWSCGVATMYFALVYLWGHDEVDKACNGVQLFRSD